ncbi:hypothetical protein F5879DRAFT_994220 [Lentinula edodes]|nr:hypothetical protein F5879DRAFT_994220 [Lentinula edodes]
MLEDWVLTFTKNPARDGKNPSAPSVLQSAVNYYRTAFYRHEEELAAKLSPNLPPDLPVLFIWGTRDTTTTSSLIHKAHKFIPRLQDFALEEKGHWILVEARDTITDKIAQWLEDLAMEARRGKAHLLELSPLVPLSLGKTSRKIRFLQCDIPRATKLPRDELPTGYPVTR